MHLNSKDLDNLIVEKNSANTMRVIHSSVAILKTFCGETWRHISGLYWISKVELHDFLKLFYGGLRNSDGEIYAKRNMISRNISLKREKSTL